MSLKTNVNFIPLTTNGAYTYKTINGARVFNANENKDGSIRITCRRLEIAKILESITNRPCNISKEVRNYHKYTQKINSLELMQFIEKLDGINTDERLDNRTGSDDSLKLVTINHVDEKPNKKVKKATVKKQAVTKR